MRRTGQWKAYLAVAAVLVVIGTAGLASSSRILTIAGFLVLVLGIGVGCGGVQRYMRSAHDGDDRAH